MISNKSFNVLIDDASVLPKDKFDISLNDLNIPFSFKSPFKHRARTIMYESIVLILLKRLIDLADTVLPGSSIEDGEFD